MSDDATDVVCGHCSYSLRGLDGPAIRCPECGRSTDLRPVQATERPEDLYCLKCGYNLRGLPGDPVQCPECGARNPLTTMRVSASSIAAEMRRMETNPALCIGAIVGWVGLSGLAVLSRVDPYYYFPPGCWLISVPGFGLLWVCRAAQFADSCRYQDGWLRVLGSYHLHGLKAFAAVFIIPVMFAAIIWGWSELIAILVGLCAGGVSAKLAVPGCYRRATSAIAILQRKVAAEMCREAERRELFTELNPDSKIRK